MAVLSVDARLESQGLVTSAGGNRTQMVLSVDARLESHSGLPLG
jgi:hypothetical protein